MIEIKKTAGCTVCGGNLEYYNRPIRAVCAVCGGEFDTYAICRDGHYVCDTCHSADILGKAERLLNASTQGDPIKLALLVFELPGLKMHGPEYHSLVPAILVTAYQNLKGQRKAGEISEALRRGRDIKGGSCGYNGACGAGIGAGIAVSVLEAATPMSGGQRGEAISATGNAMLAIAKHGGPRCCKRDAITAIEATVLNTALFTGVKTGRYTCRQYKSNRECIGVKCPYYPIRSLKIKEKSN